jgi:starch synthase
LERFSFYSHAALKTAEPVGFRPDIIHAHDWQTALAVALLKGPYRGSMVLGGTPAVFTIHNLGYQGLFGADKMARTGLPFNEFFHPEGLEYYGNLCVLKAGLVYADRLTTVSPTYSREIQTPEHGR